MGSSSFFIAHGTIPEIFASVTNSFEDAAENATNVIDEIDIVGENLIDFDTIQYSTYISPLTGEDVDNEKGLYHIATDYIPATPGHTYVTRSNTGVHHLRYVFYDSNKQYIDGTHHYGSMSQAVEEAPAGTAYLRMSVGIERMDDRNEKIEADIDSLILYERSR